MDFEAGNIMGACWNTAAAMSDEDLDAAIAKAENDLHAYQQKPIKVLFWTHYPRWDAHKKKLFNIHFYLKDAKQLRRAGRALGVTRRDESAMTVKQWVEYLQRARAMNFDMPEQR